MNTQLQRRLRASARGFTLMEMILVLAIIAVLVGMGVFMMVGVIDDANVGKAKADVKTFETTIIRYKTNMNSMPTSLEDLTRRPGNAKGPWRKLIEEGALKDAWGQPYQFRNPGRHNSTGYDIYSYGPDMKDGTEDDIGNWQN